MNILWVNLIWNLGFKPWVLYMYTYTAMFLFWWYNLPVWPMRFPSKWRDCHKLVLTIGCIAKTETLIYRSIMLNAHYTIYIHYEHYTKLQHFNKVFARIKMMNLTIKQLILWRKIDSINATCSKRYGDKLNRDNKFMWMLIEGPNIERKKRMSLLVFKGSVCFSKFEHYLHICTKRLIFIK